MSNRSRTTIGYKKPPDHTRFKKGQSGNPKGRPKGSKNFATVVDNTVNRPVSVSENGRRRTITKLEASLTQLFNKSASGDLGAIRTMIPVVQMVEGRSPSPQQEETLEEADRRVMEQFFARIGYKIDGDGNGGSNAS